MAGELIRILIAEGSTVIQRALNSVFDGQPGFDVVGVTADGRAVLGFITEKRPSVLLLGFGLNRMDAMEVLGEVMRTSPVPTVVLRPADSPDDPVEMEKLARLGAVSVARKPSVGTALDQIEEIRCELMPLVQRASNVRVIRVAWRDKEAKPEPAEVHAPSPKQHGLIAPPTGPPVSQVVVIGSSTGGPSALAEIVRKLDQKFSVPIVIAQHMPDGLIADLARYLAGECKLPVVEARDGEQIRGGCIYMCPGRAHIRLLKGGVISLTPSTNKLENSPSVDILFRSAAESFGRGALAVVLTGMGCDGAAGVRDVKAQGGAAIAQDESSCVVYGMPMEAFATGMLDAVVDVQHITSHMISFAGRRAGATSS
ncbi:chemotaxis response regulator protein-glutamate methylesterase [soil metagenome]